MLNVFLYVFFIDFLDKTEMVLYVYFNAVGKIRYGTNI